MPLDLIAARSEIAHGERTAQHSMAASLAAARDSANQHTFIRRFDAMAQAAASSVDMQFAAGAPLPALAASPSA